MFFIQFHHPHFGWLTLDESPYKTREAAEYAAKMQQDRCGAYPRRVIETKEKPLASLASVDAPCLS